MKQRSKLLSAAGHGEASWCHNDAHEAVQILHCTRVGPVLVVIMDVRLF